MQTSDESTGRVINCIAARVRGCVFAPVLRARGFSELAGECRRESSVAEHVEILNLVWFLSVHEFKKQLGSSLGSFHSKIRRTK